MTASLNVKALAAALRDGSFTPTDLLLAAAHLEGARGTDAQILKERELTASAISGAITFGAQGVNPPPEDAHWLAPFWNIGQQLAPQPVAAWVRNGSVTLVEPDTDYPGFAKTHEALYRAPGVPGLDRGQG
jgi:hypothetical protein